MIKAGKTGLPFFISLMILIFFQGCSNNNISKNDDSMQEDSSRIVIGASLASEDSSYLSVVSEYMKQAAEESGVELILKDAKWNAQIQADQLEGFIAKQVDAVILCPVNSKSMLVPLKKVQQAGIPVINLNMRVDAVSSLYTDTYVGASNSEEGALAADLIVQMLGEEGGEVAIIEGAPGSDAQIYRTQTFVEQLAATPQITIAGIGNGEWKREKAELTALDLIRKNQDLKAIYCHDSNMAMGVIRVIEEKGLKEEIQVIGISEMPEYIDAVRDERMYGFISQPAEYEGVTSVEKAVEAAEGQLLRPWYKDPIQIITKENVDSFSSS